MFGYAAILPFAVIGFLITSQTTRADEQMRPLAISGDWVAMAHQTSMTAPPDMCLVVNGVSGIAIRAADESVQFRVVNKTWALPTGVAGTIMLTIGDWKTVLDIDDNTDTMVNAELSNESIVPMFTAMDKSSNMSVTVGKAKPVLVSLSGSTRATNAFSLLSPDS
jgi:hypothetical protein